MGVYASTNYVIEVANKKTALQVKEVIEKLEKDDTDGNTYYDSFEVDDTQISSFMDSGRIQNLEYKCGKIWKAIKDIEGVINFECPFMSEGDGYYQSKE